jgi:hypothetical protein
MDAPVREAVGIPGIAETRAERRQDSIQTSRDATDVCSRSTSSSRSKSCAMEGEGKQEIA